MLPLVETGLEFDQLNQRCLAAAHAVVSLLPCKEVRRIIVGGSEFCAPLSDLRDLYLIQEGGVALSVGDSKLCFYEEGDLFGWEEISSLPGAKLFAEAAIFVDVYSKEDLFSLLGTSGELRRSFSCFLGCSLARLYAVLSTLMKDGELVLPQLKAAKAGSEIIAQGAPADEVYFLAEGGADVYVDGVKAGEILVDEIFGALGALTDNRRTAQVVANKDSLYMALPKEEFYKLLRFRPKTVEKLIHDMARTIISLNEQIVQLKGTPAVRP